MQNTKVQDTNGKVQQIISIYEARGLNNGSCLLPPAQTSDLATAEVKLGFEFPEPIRQLFAIVGGQEYICPGVSGLFGAHRMLSPIEIAQDYLMYQKTHWIDARPGTWHPGLVPFASWDAYALVMCRVSKRVWEFEPCQGLSERSFDDLGLLLDAVIVAATDMDEPQVNFIE